MRSVNDDRATQIANMIRGQGWVGALPLAEMIRNNLGLTTNKGLQALRRAVLTFKVSKREARDQEGDSWCEYRALEGQETTTVYVVGEIVAERVRQLEKWWPQDHPNGLDQGVARAALWAATGKSIERQARFDLDESKGQGDNWAAILMEEVGEALQALDGSDLRGELIQVAAVAMAWVQHLDRRCEAGEFYDSWQEDTEDE